MKLNIFLYSLVFFGICWMMCPGIIHAEPLYPSDITVSNYTSRSWQDEYLYLSNDAGKQDYLVFKALVDFEPERVTSLYLFSKTTETRASIEIAYITEGFTIDGLIDEDLLSKPYYRDFTFRPGWNRLELRELPELEGEIYGIRIKLSSMGMLTFQAKASEVVFECKSNFSPYIEMAYRRSSEEDQESPESKITKIEKNVNYDVYREAILPKVPEKAPDKQGTVLGVEAKTPETKGEQKPPVKQIPSKCTVHYYLNIPDKKPSYKCTFRPALIKSIQNTKFGEKDYEVKVQSSTKQQIQVVFFRHKCKKKTLLDIRTFFNCQEITEKLGTKTFTASIESIPAISDMLYKSTAKYSGDDVEQTIKSTKDMSKEKLVLRSRILANFKYSSKFPNININHYSVNSKAHTIPPAAVSSSKPLAFFFKDPSVITQFYGKHKDGHFHTGIDFALTRKPVYSPAKGEVINYAWDDYYGKCLSGGNILKLKHSDKLYTVYMHLSSRDKKGSGVTAGEKIATTGNTGSYKCKDLGYHLHFEVRLGPKQISKTDPLDYLNIDWDKVKILTKERLPGDLPAFVKLIK